MHFTVHNCCTQNRPDNFPSYPPMMSVWGKRRQLSIQPFNPIKLESKMFTKHKPHASPWNQSPTGTEWRHPPLLHAVCSECIPIVCCRRVTGVLSAFVVPGDLDLWPWQSNSSEWGTIHVFTLNLAQIRSVVFKIFHTQTKWMKKKQKKSQTALKTEPYLHVVKTTKHRLFSFTHWCIGTA